MKLIHPQIEQYAQMHTVEEPDLIRELLAFAADDLEHVDMISGPVIGQFLSMLVKISGAQKVLEVGTFIGYSALYMARSLPEDGQLITCEYNERYEAIAKRFFKKSSDSHKIRLVMGEALETIAIFNKMFDFVFLDADKINYPRYYDLLIPKINPGGLLLVDNVFWQGTVLDSSDEKARAIDTLNTAIHKDERVEQVMLTVRDGLTLVRKLPA